MRRLKLFVVENGITRSHEVAMDPDLNVSREEIKEGWQKLVPCMTLQDLMTEFVVEFIDRKRAVRLN